MTTLGDLLLRTARRRPAADALVFPGHRTTYGDLAEAAVRRARSLLAMGIEPGDHVGVLLPTSREFAEVFFAVALIGGVCVPINARYRAAELAYVIGNGDVTAVLTTSAVAEQVNFVTRLNEAFPALRDAPEGAGLSLAEAPRLRRLVLLNRDSAPGFMPFAEFEALAQAVTEERVHHRRRQVRVRDTGLILYTSGTTSSPKGCMLSHEAVARTAQALAERYEVKPEDSFWSPLPMFHIAAILPLCAVFGVGGAYHAMQSFNAGQALEMLEAERATLTYPCFAPFIADMIFHPEYAKRDLSRIRLMNSNLAVQPDSFRDELKNAMPQAVQVGSYGLTEASGTVCTHGVGDPYEQRTRRLGRPLPGISVRIARADGSDAAPLEVGEIVVRSFGTFDGYYKDPEKTAETLRGGWLHTGDLGSLDDSGQIMFHGRLKDMLKVGGENVACAEIEALVGRHPGVKLCQVVGAPDPRLTEVPVAFVELRPGSSADEAEIIGFCKGRIAGFKVPRHVRFVAEWPMSASKIQKFVLAKSFAAENPPA